MTQPASVLPERAPWRKNLGLFLVTAASVFVTGVLSFPTTTAPPTDEGFFASLARAAHSITPGAIANGAAFAGTLLTILVAHELGHYVAARIHKVDASLPFFIPMPILSPFGTMGAVIRMRGVIPTRRALLDIGAAGPLAGLAFALPLYAWGVAHSHAVPADPEHMVELGESVMIKLLDHAFAPTAPAGQTLFYSPVAFGAWGGLFVTMINLLPVGQLDGGHVAYALFGEKQDRYAGVVHRAMLVFFGVIVGGHLGRDLLAGHRVTSASMAGHVGNALFWLVWFQAIAAVGTMAARARDAEDDDAPPPISIRTRIFATFGLVVVASLAREHASWLLVGSFLAGFGFLVAMERKGGAFSKTSSLVDHPPTSPAPLDRVRAGIAIATLVLFALLFMPEPFSL
jgi:membrane-associated protease RseP (regulator of RpoE activity)